MALVTSNEFSVSIVPSEPTSVYTYNVAQDSKSFEWRYQSMGPLSDGVSFILRGTGDHDTWGDNSIRFFNAQSLVTTTLYDHNVAGNRAPFTQYDNWMTPLLPAAFTGDTDWLVWWTIGTFRMSSLAPPAGAWTHVKVKLRSGDDLARPIAALSSANPAVPTILNDGADDVIATNLSGGPVKAYLYGPGCSLHDTVVQTSNVVSDATTITLAVNGSAVTGFVANQLWASPVSNGTLSATDVFSSGGRHSDLYVDKTSGQRFLGAGTGAAPYNGVQIYWPGGNKYVMFGGGAGSTSPISTNYSWFVQQNTTAPPAWEIEDFALQWGAFMEMVDPGVTVSLGNPFDARPETLVEVFEGVGRQNFRLALDLGHFLVYAEIDLPSWLGQIAAACSTVYIHSNDGKVDMHVEPFQGILRQEQVALMKGYLPEETRMIVKSFNKTAIPRCVEWVELALKTGE